MAAGGNHSRIGRDRAARYFRYSPASNAAVPRHVHQCSCFTWSGKTGWATISISEYALGHLLALYAGFFLFMGATDLLPEAHQHPSRLRVGLTAAGFVAIFCVATLARMA